MYTIRKLFKFEGAHILSKSYSKECQMIHGHSYKVEIFLSSETLNEDGMVIDFKLLKEIVNPIIQEFDHKCIHHEDLDLEESLGFLGFLSVDYNPTAENMCKNFHNAINSKLYSIGFEGKLKVRIHETDTGWAEYETH